MPKLKLKDLKNMWASEIQDLDPATKAEFLAEIESNKRHQQNLSDDSSKQLVTGGASFPHQSSSPANTPYQNTSTSSNSNNHTSHSNINSSPANTTEQDTPNSGDSNTRTSRSNTTLTPDGNADAGKIKSPSKGSKKRKQDDFNSRYGDMVDISTAGPVAGLSGENGTPDPDDFGPPLRRMGSSVAGESGNNGLNQEPDIIPFEYLPPLSQLRPTTPLSYTEWENHTRLPKEDASNRVRLRCCLINTFYYCRSQIFTPDISRFFDGAVFPMKLRTNLGSENVQSIFAGAVGLNMLETLHRVEFELCTWKSHEARGTAYHVVASAQCMHGNLVIQEHPGIEHILKSWFEIEWMVPAINTGNSHEKWDSLQWNDITLLLQFASRVRYNKWGEYRNNAQERWVIPQALEFPAPLYGATGYRIGGTE